MNNILFLTSTYLPNPGANGINTHAVIKKMKDNGYNVSVISTKNSLNELDYEVIEGINIYRITPSNFTQKKRNMESSKHNLLNEIRVKRIVVLRKLKIILNFYKFPNFDSDQNIKTIKLLKKIIKENNINSIISVYKPYANIYAIKKIKREFPNIKCGVYFLDLLDSMVRPNFLPKKYYTKLIDKENLRILKKMDYILVPISSKEYYEKRIFKKSNDKIEFTNFPTLNIRKETAKEEYNKIMNDKKIIFTYAGTLDLKYRNPEFFLKTFFEIYKELNNIEVHILGRNNCESLFDNYSEIMPLRNHGFSPQSKVIKYNNKSDILINISNSSENAVPSKIFELFSTGKPIINFVQRSDDFSTKYFDLYPCCFNFYYWEDFDIQLSMMNKFILNNLNTKVDLKRVEEIYYMNTPEYTYNIIEKRN